MDLAWTAGAENLLNGTKAYVLAVIEHSNRRVRVLGATEHPVQSWVIQQARNPLMDLADARVRAKFVLHDRDASFVWKKAVAQKRIASTGDNSEDNEL